MSNKRVFSGIEPVGVYRCLTEMFYPDRLYHGLLSDPELGSLYCGFVWIAKSSL